VPDSAGPALLEALRESERRYRLLADNASDVIWTVDLRTMRFTYVSPSITRLRGLSVEEALAEPVEASMTPESLARVQASLADLFADRGPDRVLVVVDQPCKDGSLKHVEVSAGVVRDAGGNPVEVVGVSRDATERIRADDRLARSEALLRAITDASPDAIFAKDRDGRWTFANPAVLRELGRPREEVIGRTDLEFQRDARSAERLMDHDREIMETGAARTLTEAVLTAGGPRRFLTSKAPLRDAEGRVVGLVGTAKDVTELEQANEALRLSRQRLALALDGSADGFWDVDAARERVFLSRRYRQIVGRPGLPEEVGFEDLLATIDPADLPTIIGDIERIRAGLAEGADWECRVRAEDGAMRWVHFRGRVVERDAAGAAARVAGTISDIHERKSAEEALRASEARLRIIARCFPAGSVALFDADDRLVFAEGSRLLLLPDASIALGRRLSEFLPPDLGPRLDVALHRARAGETVRGDVRMGDRVVEAVVSPAVEDGRSTGMCILVAQDVTARRELEANLAVASRLAAMGTLLSGIAHEINNPLAGSMAGTDWAVRRARDLAASIGSGGETDPRRLADGLGEVVDALEDAMAGNRRIAAIVKDLITVGHPGPERSRVRLRDVVSDAVLRMPAPLRERCMVRVVDDVAPDVAVAPGQLSQAVANLLDNAAASMPVSGGADIVLRIATTPEGRARIEVEDRGTGMAPEVLERVFDPFFTTRPVGQGMGLGLSVAHAIVTAHGGTLTATSTPGKGSTFRIELPPAT
jgi:PAS domain S-box-containing protein